MDGTRCDRTVVAGCYSSMQVCKYVKYVNESVSVPFNNQLY